MRDGDYCGLPCPTDFLKFIGIFFLLLPLRFFLFFGSKSDFSFFLANYISLDFMERCPTTLPLLTPFLIL